MKAIGIAKQICKGPFETVPGRLPPLGVGVNRSSRLMIRSGCSPVTQAAYIAPRGVIAILPVQSFKNGKAKGYICVRVAIEFLTCAISSPNRPVGIGVELLINLEGTIIHGRQYALLV